MRSAIITGAGSGIGRAAALRLAKQGFAVALVGRTRDKLEKVAQEITTAGGKTLAIPADVSQLEQVESMVHRAMEGFGRVDVLVNNAGVAPVATLAKLAPQQWQELLDTNLSASFYTTRTVWPIMQRQHKSGERGSKGGGGARENGEAAAGVIINISSMAARDPFPGLGAYGAAKLALQMLALVTAREGREVGIRALCIAPGAVDTPMLREVMGNQPLNPEELLQPEDVAEMIADAVAGSLRYSSGETIFVHKRPA